MGSVAITLAGVSVQTRVSGFVIHDILNDAPNTCALRFDGSESPQVGQALEATMVAGSVRLFVGQLQTVALSYEGGKNNRTVWACTAIDDTAKANWRRPFGTWTNVSATTIADDLAADFAPTFTTQIEAGLPAVSITFDGSATFISCLARLASAVGGYCKVEDDTIYLFIDDATSLPDPIDASNPFLNDPPIEITTDASQLRTRVYGKGYGENVPTDVAASETILPLSDGAQFNAGGGRALIGTTADGAQSQQLTYTGLRLATPGTLVGPGASPPSAPILAAAAGTGVTNGVHLVAFTHVTAAGESIPSPTASINSGTVPAPTTSVTAGVPTVGLGLDGGSHTYVPVFRTAAGSTTAGPVSNAITATSQVAAPSVASPWFVNAVGTTSEWGVSGSNYTWKYIYRRTSDNATTTPSVVSEAFACTLNGDAVFTGTGTGHTISPPSGYVAIFFRSKDGGAYKECTDMSPSGGNYYDLTDEANLGGAPPSTNNTGNGVCQVTGIPVGPGLVTHVDLYRAFNGGTAKLAFSVTNGTTSHSDSVTNAARGADVPSTNTTVAGQISVTGISIGPATVTARKVYMTTAGGSTLKLVTTLADNTTTILTISMADGSLGANAPTSDTSGLTQPQGQINTGATSLLVASATPFYSGGGWVALGGGQTVRYTGITGNSLTGVPASGAGSILTTVIYGQQAVPAPSLTGVSGMTLAVARGSAVHIFVQRDDTAAQTAHAARSGGDGIVEYLFSDARRGEASLIAYCDADLALFSTPIVSVTYATRDLKSKSGKAVVINLETPAVNQTLTIQEVSITEIDIAPVLAPRFTVKASSVRFSLEDLLRKLAGTTL